MLNCTVDLARSRRDEGSAFLETLTMLGRHVRILSLGLESRRVLIEI